MDFKYNVIVSNNFDIFDIYIICLCETWLFNNNVIQCDRYKWIGQNRLAISKRAIRGSGGVGVLVKWQLYNMFDISILDSSFEGILWIKFQSKDITASNAFSLCVCYLPPANSSRGDISEEFFDTLGF